MLKAGIVAALIVLASAPEALAQQQLQYRYDAQGRLVRVARPTSGGSGNITTYVYDDAYNRTQRSIAIGPLARLLREPTGTPQTEFAGTGWSPPTTLAAQLAATSHTDQPSLPTSAVARADALPN